MVTKPTGRPRGRPSVPLAERPGRYLYAELEALVQRAREGGISELKAVGALALMLSDNISPADNPMGFTLTPSSRRQAKGNNAEHHRYGPAHLPLADDVTRMLRGFRNDPWFIPMAAAWRLVIDGELEKADEARALATGFDLRRLPRARSPQGMTTHKGTWQ